MFTAIIHHFKKEYYLVQQFNKSYQFILMVKISTKNKAFQWPPYHWLDFCLRKFPVQFQTIKNIKLYNNFA